MQNDINILRKNRDKNNRNDLFTLMLHNPSSISKIYNCSRKYF